MKDDATQYLTGEASDGGSESLLGKALRDAREQKGWKQTELARRVKLNGAQISYFENGTRQPSIIQLAELAAELGLNVDAMVLARTADEIASDKGEAWPMALRHQHNELITNFQNRVRTCAPLVRQGRASGRTFDDFPHCFGDVVIVTGDKREEKPKNAGDIGAYSASPIDDRWIWSLELNSRTEKVSDKEFVISSEQRLRELYGKRTLLVVGSPASNHLARIVNRRAVFRFNFHTRFARELDAIIENYRHLRDGLVLEKLKQNNLDQLKSIMRRFYSYGIIDPLLRDVRGYAAAPDVDYATITFAANPYSDQ